MREETSEGLVIDREELLNLEKIVDEKGSVEVGGVVLDRKSMDKFKQILEEGRKLTLGRKVILCDVTIPRGGFKERKLYIHPKARTTTYPENTPLPLELSYDGGKVIRGEAVVPWTRHSLAGGSFIGYIIISGIDD